MNSRDDGTLSRIGSCFLRHGRDQRFVSLDSGGWCHEVVPPWSMKVSDDGEELSFPVSPARSNLRLAPTPRA